MRPLVLVILDGWGYSGQTTGNAIAMADTPIMDRVARNYPGVLLQASGKAVGLDWGEPGNSEVGHLTIGAGRTLFQYAPRITQSIENGSFLKNETLLGACNFAKQHNSTLHIVGLLGSGSVHSRFDHILALLKLAKAQGIEKLYLHLFTDGKDSGLKEAPTLLSKLRENIDRIGLGKVASLVGRWYGMDRDHNWDRTRVAFDAITNGMGQATDDAADQLKTYYENGLTDTTMLPIILDPEGKPTDNDAIMFFNFREDSMRQITRVFTEAGFDKFVRVLPANLFITWMTQYHPKPTGSPHIAFPPPEVPNNLAEMIDKSGLHQMHVAETEKFAHTTYFFNCFKNEAYKNETDILIPSDKEHLGHPEMGASEIADKFNEEYPKGYEFAVINLANPDVIAHTGNLEAAVKSIGAADIALGRILNTAFQRGASVIITADHGNAEGMLYRSSGEAETKHNTNPVPLYLVMPELERSRTDEEIAGAMSDAHGILSDVAPTILELMGLEVPLEMTGTSLLSLLTK
ncbi:MAG: 2,3-bisphosphoglycerate-independent phosphoglycerate mutase [Patescibacteria group bacterium]